MVGVAVVSFLTVVSGAVAGTAELDVAAALEDAVEECFGEVGIMEHMTPGGKRLVGGEEQGLAGEVAFVDDLEEDVGGVVLQAEISDLIDHKDVGVEVVAAR